MDGGVNMWFDYIWYASSMTAPETLPSVEGRVYVYVGALSASHTRRSYVKRNHSEPTAHYRTRLARAGELLDSWSQTATTRRTVLPLH